MTSFSENAAASPNLVLAARKITLLSYFDLTLSVAAILHLFVNNTVSLEKTSLFFAKSLPFRSTEVNISYKIYKCSIALILYQFMMIIATPAIKLVTHNPMLFLMLFISQQLLFIGCYLIFDSLTAFLSRWNIFEKIYEIVLLFTAFLFLLNYRFDIETAFSKIPVSVDALIVLLGFAALFIFAGSVLLAFRTSGKEESEYLESFFFNVKSLSFGKFKVFLLPTLRRRSVTNIIFMFIIFLAVVLLQQGTKSLLPSSLVLSPFLGLVLVYYADSTSKVRRVLKTLNFKPYFEVITLILLCLTLSSPTLIFCILARESLTSFFLSICVSIFAVLLGFLFPKSEGNLNDSISSLLLVVLFIVLSLIFKYRFAIFPTLLLELVALHLLVKKESEKIE
ncbi:MAG: hypothetical protein LBV19_02780 [Streptococcaceae bacterium]|nr:hypothetical protein [Streptococcaceae bacterium]